MTAINVTVRNYSATLDRATGRVEIRDTDTNLWAGDGQWNGNSITDCAAILGGSQDAAEEIYAELDSAMADAAKASLSEEQRIDLRNWRDGHRHRSLAQRLLDAGLIAEFWELVDETGDSYRAGFDGNAFATEDEADEAADEMPGVEWESRRVVR